MVLDVADAEVGDGDIRCGKNLNTERHAGVQHASAEQHDVLRIAGAPTQLDVADRAGTDWSPN